MRRLLVIVFIALGAPAFAQGANPPQQGVWGGAFTVSRGPFTLELKTINDCKFQVQVTSTWGIADNSNLEKGGDGIGTTLDRERRTIPSGSSVMSSFPVEFGRAADGGHFAVNVVPNPSKGEPVIVQDAPGKCRKVTPTCSGDYESWLVMVSDSVLSAPAGRLAQTAVLTPGTEEEPVACPTPKTATVPDEVGTTTGLDYPAIPIPGGNPGPPVDDQVFDGGPETKPPTPPKPDDGSFLPNPVRPDPGLDSKVRSLGGEPIDFTPLRCAPSDPDCVPLDECRNGACGGESYAPKEAGIDDIFQLIMGEMPRVQISISMAEARPPRALNPLGLLAKSASDFIDWWMPRLQAADDAIIEQAGLKSGLQFIINSQGGSTGKNLTMQVLNFTGKPVSLQGALALEPLKKDAQQKTMQAFTKLAGRQLPTKVDLNGYCLEFLKLPPIAGQVLRVAPPEIQQRFEPMKRVMSAANRLSQTGALKPDSNPASYADAIKQWAIWTTQEKFTQSKFADAFVTHTKKNVEAAGQKWSKQFEDMVRQAVPNRWRDIAQVLKGAGAPVPQ